jgi:FAD/FMN-containing dehydrogenase
MTSTARHDVTALRARMTGSVLLPEDDGYDEARSVWNGEIDKRPAVIARCTGPDAVASALGYAHEVGLEVAVRGEGTGTGGRPCRSAG